MTCDELCAALAAECERGCDYVAKISSAYYSEEWGIIAGHTSYEIFSVDIDGNIVWFNDWYEGQEDCCYEKPILINDLIRAYKITKTDGDAISRQAAIRNVAQITKAVANSDKQKSLCGRIIFMLEHM